MTAHLHTGLAALYVLHFFISVLCFRCSASLDFANPDALRHLTRALLKEDFGVLDWWVPDGQLIPPVPNRLNYIHWIEDLLRMSCPLGAISDGCIVHRKQCGHRRCQHCQQVSILLLLGK